MKRRIILTALMLVFSGVLALAPPIAVAAQSELELVTDYSKLEGESGDSFEFEIDLQYHGDETRVFDLDVTGPQYWTSTGPPAFRRAIPRTSASRTSAWSLVWQPRRR